MAKIAQRSKVKYIGKESEDSPLKKGDEGMVMLRFSGNRWTVFFRLPKGRSWIEDGENMELETEFPWTPLVNESDLELIE